MRDIKDIVSKSDKEFLTFLTMHCMGIWLFLEEGGKPRAWPSHSS